MEKLDIEQQKRKLLIERNQLKTLLEDLGVKHPDDEFDLDPIADADFDADRAEEAEVADMLDDFMKRSSEEETLEKRYRDVHEALMRIKIGEYGKCATCGKPIEVVRLKVNPAAKYCIEHMEDDFSTSAL